MPTPVFDEYDELESAYNDPSHLMYKKMQLVLDTVRGGDSLLDFGCGQGELLVRVCGRFQRLAGIDATEMSLDITKRKLGDKVELYRHDGTMPKVQGTFDWVTCLDVLEHLPDPASVLRELNDLMKPGARMIVTVPNWYDIVNAKILRRNRFHLHAHTPWGWMSILRDAGFHVESCRAVSFPVFGSDALARHLYFLGMCILIVAAKG